MVAALFALVAKTELKNGAGRCCTSGKPRFAGSPRALLGKLAMADVYPVICGLHITLAKGIAVGRVDTGGAWWLFTVLRADVAGHRAGDASGWSSAGAR